MCVEQKSRKRDGAQSGSTDPAEYAAKQNERRYLMEAIERVCAFLKEAGTYYLATADGDQPRVRPFGTANVFEGKLYIQTGKVKDISKQLAANPKFEICAFKDGVWVRISGKMVNDDRREAKVDMLEHYPSLRRMYSEDDDNTQVLYIEDGTATFSSFTAEPETVTF